MRRLHPYPHAGSRTTVVGVDTIATVVIAVVEVARLLYEVLFVGRARR
jgi:hypothetical protein